MDRKDIICVIGVISFLVLSELVLWILGFRYYPVESGFNITPRYEAFEETSGRYQTKKEKLDVFPYQSFSVEKERPRIFVLGGSSVYYLGNLTHLSARIAEESDQDAEIINAGALSYGSNRVLLHVQEILAYDPDIIIIYSGHNEFEEQFMRETFYRENILMRINNILLRISRIYQLMSKYINKAMRSILYAGIKSIKGGTNPFFPPERRVQWNIDFNKALVYENYRQNLEEMVRLAKNYDIRIILSTVAYNRRIPPFRIENDTYEQCDILHNEEKYTQAAACYEAALDSDLQPHRATETSNRIVRAVAEKYRVPLAEVDERVVELSEHNIPGYDLFGDHCHLNEQGNMILQEVLFESLTQ